MNQLSHLIHQQRINLISKGYTGTESLLQHLSLLLKDWKAKDPAAGDKSHAASGGLYSVTLKTESKGGQLQVEWSFSYEYSRHPAGLSLVAVQASVFDVSVSSTNKQNGEVALLSKQELLGKLRQSLVIASQKHWHRYKQTHRRTDNLRPIGRFRR